MTSVARVLASLQRVLSSALVGALLLFGQLCALRGGFACAAPVAAAHAEAHCTGADHDGDGGCSDCPSGACAHSSVCCSTWAPAPARETLPAPSPALLPAAAIVPAQAPLAAFAAAPAPILDESPPPRLPILRL